MDPMHLAAVILAFSWGLAFSVFLWLTAPGRFIRLHRTYLSVAAGFGVDLLLLLFVVDVQTWLWLVAVVAASSIAIFGFCIGGEYREHADDMTDAKRT